MTVVYDAGALIAAERSSARMLSLHAAVLRGGRRPVVPTIVLGQVWRGTARQAVLSRLLKSCQVLNLDVVTAKQGGQLCGQAGTADLADAVVAVLAIRHNARVATSDPGDISWLGEAAGWHLPIVTI
ncbi:MAG: PIN domain-containing protein [Pseudonocardiales bacterium]|nr:PIN domain-containing protein [Pseudonocardiales bacterium]